MNNSFKRYIKAISSKDIELYDDLTPSSEDSLEGARRKKFIRMSGDAFNELFNEICNNPNCSYVTYMNDVIKSGYVPKYLSVLTKENTQINRRNNQYGLEHFSDVIACKIMNFFGCPTTYETLFDIDGEVLSCSVDFNKTDEDFYSLSGIGGFHSFSSASDVSGNLNKIDGSLKCFRDNILLDNMTDEEFAKMSKKFKEDYVYSWMIRYLIMNDRDFYDNNVGLIYDKKNNEFRMSPNYDMEACMTNLDMDVGTINNSCNIKFIDVMYPQVFDKFVDRLQQLRSLSNGKSKLQNIIESVVGDNSESIGELMTDFNKRISTINNLIVGYSPTNIK